MPRALHPCSLGLGALELPELLLLLKSISPKPLKFASIPRNCPESGAPQADLQVEGWLDGWWWGEGRSCLDPCCHVLGGQGLRGKLPTGPWSTQLPSTQKQESRQLLPPQISLGYTEPCSVATKERKLTSSLKAVERCLQITIQGYYSQVQAVEAEVVRVLAAYQWFGGGVEQCNIGCLEDQPDTSHRKIGIHT